MKFYVSKNFFHNSRFSQNNDVFKDELVRLFLAFGEIGVKIENRKKFKFPLTFELNEKKKNVVRHTINTNVNWYKDTVVW